MNAPPGAPLGGAATATVLQVQCGTCLKVVNGEGLPAP